MNFKKGLVYFAGGIVLLSLGWIYWPNPNYDKPISAYTYSSTDSLINERFDIQSLEMPADYAGPVVTTFMHLAPDSSSGRAVLYVHGYGDYFFQLHEAEWFARNGYDFYAIDLRKYGRSLMSHQRPCFAKDLSEYYADLDTAIALIRERDGMEWLLLNGHSTGGLITSLYCAEGRRAKQVDALLLNSPFFEFNVSESTRTQLPWFTLLSAFRPGKVIRNTGQPRYSLSIYKGYHGEWDFSQVYKPARGFPVYLGWMRAIYEGHRQVEDGLDLDLPIMVLHSDSTFRGEPYDPAMQRMDAVLDVNHIRQRSPLLGTEVQMEEVPDALHDVFLSREDVRNEAFRRVKTWMEELERAEPRAQ